MSKNGNAKKVKAVKKDDINKIVTADTITVEQKVKSTPKSKKKHSKKVFEDSDRKIKVVVKSDSPISDADVRAAVNTTKEILRHEAPSFRHCLIQVIKRIWKRLMNGFKKQA